MLKLLLFSPAFLTSEYLKGRHKKYISPIRIYLIISLIYFFTLSISDTVSFLSINTDENTLTEQREEGIMESVFDSLAHVHPVEDSTQNFLQKYLSAKAKQLDTK